MKVWVLRHGQAEPHSRDDAGRALTAHGREEVLRSAAHLMGLPPLDGIYASPYVRAQQTAWLVQKALGFGKEISTVGWLTPDTDPAAVVTELEKLGQGNLLLVSHQPLVSKLVGLLVAGSRQDGPPMHTASLAELEGEFVLAGAMTLRGIEHA
ncbi:Phosphohistidine phosphatase SixA [compost metagenome]